MTVAIDMIVEEVSEPIRYNSNSQHTYRKGGGKIDDVFVQVFPGSEGASVPRARAILQSASDCCQGELLTHFAGPLPLPSKCLLPKTLLPGGTAPFLSSFPLPLCWSVFSPPSPFPPLFLLSLSLSLFTHFNLNIFRLTVNCCRFVNSPLFPILRWFTILSIEVILFLNLGANQDEDSFSAFFCLILTIQKCLSTAMPGYL